MLVLDLDDFSCGTLHRDAGANVLQLIWEGKAL